MTPEQIEIAKALGQVTYRPASSEKRFAKNVAFLAEHSPELPISGRQDAFMRQLAWRFRRQMPERLVPPQKPEPMAKRQTAEPKLRRLESPSSDLFA